MGYLWISLIIVIIVAINELTWLGRSGLAWVILALAIAVGLQAVYLLTKIEEKEQQTYVGNRNELEKSGKQLSNIIEEEEEPTYVGNRKTGIYHLHHCHHALSIDPENKVRFYSAKQATMEGFEPCKVCKPRPVTTRSGT